MDVAAFADADISVLLDDGAVLEDYGVGDGDLVIGGGDTDGAVDGWADSEDLAYDGIEVRRGLDVLPVFLW